MRRRRQPRSRWRRRRAVRRSLIAGLLLLGSAALVEDLARRSADGAGVPAALASEAVPAGAVLGPDDVTLTDVAPDSPLASVALSREAVVGRTTTDQLEPGEMITAGRLADADDAPAGTTVMPVPFPDATIANYLTPGAVLDVIWIPDEFQREPPRIVARAAVVMPDPVPGGPDDRAAWQDRSILLRVTDADAVELAAALGSGRLSVLLRSG
jgi:hypothetical protein